MHLSKGAQLVRFHIDPVLLHDGLYIWNLSVIRKDSIEHLIWLMRAGKVRISSPYRPLGSIPYLPDTSDVEVEIQDAEVVRNMESLGN